MDQGKAQHHIHQHADAVVKGDIDAVVADFAEPLRPDVPELAKALPQPVTSAEVLGVEGGEHECIATIRYSNEEQSVTIRSRWQEVEGRPLIHHAEPVT